MPDDGRIVVSWDRVDRYPVATTPTPGPLNRAQIVNVTTGHVSVPIRLGSIVVQCEPDDWTEEVGPDAALALALVT